MNIEKVAPMSQMIKIFTWMAFWLTMLLAAMVVVGSLIRMVTQ